MSEKKASEQGLKHAAEQVAGVDEISEEETGRRVAKARQLVARQRQVRLEQALEEFEKLEKEGKNKERYLKIWRG